MDMNKYVGEKVSITTDDGLNICGEVALVGYDEESDRDYLLIDVVKYFEQLYEEDISSIEIIEN